MISLGIKLKYIGLVSLIVDLEVRSTHTAKRFLFTSAFIPFKFKPSNKTSTVSTNACVCYTACFLQRYEFNYNLMRVD